MRQTENIIKKTGKIYIQRGRTRPKLSQQERKRKRKPTD